MSTHEKACTKCGVVKPLDGFSRNKRRKDGRQSECKECMKERGLRYREENRDKVLESERRYREENRDKERERHRRYYEENRDKALELNRRWREANRDKAIESSRRWREANRDKVLESERRYYEENRDKVLERGRRHYEENLEYERARRRNRMRDYQSGSGAFLDKPKGSPWTPEDDAFLLANDGRTYYQKAIELGRTHSSVNNRLHRLRKAGKVGQDA